MKPFFSLLFVVIAICACRQDTENMTITTLTPSEKSAKIIAADNQFGLEVFQKINHSPAEQKNVMISPISISLALAMVYNGANGNTKTQMEEMLHKSGMPASDINQSYKELVEALASHDPKVELAISNAVFYRNSVPVKSDFITTNQNYYQAEVKGLDFTKPAETRDQINGWVNTNTKGKIDQIITTVNPEDMMYILNAIYFNGKWKYSFDSKQTSTQNFTKEDNSSVQIPMMTIENPFNYFSTSDIEMLEMPYGSGKFSMLVLLPKAGKKADDVISSLSVDHLNEWTSNLTEQKKTVFLPKFEFRYEKSLISNLQSLGMTDAFNSAKADLSGISDALKLIISEVMHKSYIKVDEAGTEAAAVTGITVGTTSAGPEPNTFRADHPFVFIIREKDTHAILFIGKVTDPSQS